MVLIQVPAFAQLLKKTWLEGKGKQIQVRALR